MKTVDFGEIGRNIKLQRTRKGMRQEELAELTDVSSAHISHVENVHTKPSVELLIRIANALEIDIDTLCGSNLYAARRPALSRQIAEVLDGAPTAVVDFTLELSKASRKLYDQAQKQPD